MNAFVRNFVATTIGAPGLLLWLGGLLGMMIHAVGIGHDLALGSLDPGKLDWKLEASVAACWLLGYAMVAFSQVVQRNGLPENKPESFARVISFEILAQVFCISFVATVLTLAFSWNEGILVLWLIAPAFLIAAVGLFITLRRLAAIPRAERLLGGEIGKEEDEEKRPDAGLANPRSPSQKAPTPPRKHPELILKYAVGGPGVLLWMAGSAAAFLVPLQVNKTGDSVLYIAAASLIATAGISVFGQAMVMMYEILTWDKRYRVAGSVLPRLLGMKIARQILSVFAVFLLGMVFLAPGKMTPSVGIMLLVAAATAIGCVVRISLAIRWRLRRWQGELEKGEVRERSDG